MDIKNPRYFIAIADEKSLSRAAASIFISQSSLSYYITSLEKSIGIPLLHRMPGGVELTPAGERYLAACRAVVEIGDSLSEELCRAESGGDISVIAASVWGRRALSDLIPAFAQTHPHVHIRVSHASSERVPDMLESREADFALVSWNPYRPLRREDRLLGTEPLLFAVSAFHPFAYDHPQEQLTIMQIAQAFGDDRFILASSGSVSHTAVTRAFDNIGFSPVQSYEIDDHELTQELVARRCGVAFIPQSVIVPDDRIRYYTVPDLLRCKLLMSKPAGLFTQYEQDFFDMLIGCFREQG